MKNKYHIKLEDCCQDDGTCKPEIVYITSHKHGGYLSSFITIESDDGYNDSPFENIDDAKLFAEIIVKLLNKVGEIDDIE